MESEAITFLRQEHKLIHDVAEVTKRLKDGWKIDKASYLITVEKLVCFLKEYADEFHHRKEEEVLFPKLMKNPEFSLGELIDELESHHADFRDYILQIDSAIEAGNYKEVDELLAKYFEELLDHIAIENDELFALAEDLLTENELDYILGEFHDIDRAIGIKRKSELASLFTSTPTQ